MGSWLGQQGPMECFHITKNSKGAMKEWMANSTFNL
jgi:hypothetical protein